MAATFPSAGGAIQNRLTEPGWRFVTDSGSLRRAARIPISIGQPWPVVLVRPVRFDRTMPTLQRTQPWAMSTNAPITLSPELAAAVDGAVGGEYASASEVIRDALRPAGRRRRDLYGYSLEGVARADPTGHRQRGFGEFVSMDGKQGRGSPPIRTRTDLGVGGHVYLADCGSR